MKPPKEALPQPPMVTLMVCYVGSIAHGTYQPKDNPDSIDDRDIMGCYLGGTATYLGFGGPDEVRRFVGEWDCVSYEIRKLMGLLLKSNPNVLSLLWTDPRHVIESSPQWERILEARDAFVSKKAYHSFSGYAWSQFTKMEKFSKDGYMGAKRFELVERHGYDAKNAAHLVRLLKMGTEFLTEGRLYVERKSDAQQLIDIKSGGWSLAEVKDYARHLFKEAEMAYARSTLPNEPDRARVEALMIEILRESIV